MGFKKLKEHYRIEHIVQVGEQGICIGSPYIHDIIVVGLDGAIIKANDGRSSEDLRRYMEEFRADPDKLREVVKAEDTFERSLPVYTYHNGEIIEKRCEKYGWPNVTHDGCMMYENTFSADRSQVVAWAKQNAELAIKQTRQQIERIKSDLAEAEGYLVNAQAWLEKLEE